MLTDLRLAVVPIDQLQLVLVTAVDAGDARNTDEGFLNDLAMGQY